MDAISFGSLRQTDVLVGSIETVVRFVSNQKKWIWKTRNYCVLAFMLFGNYDHLKGARTLNFSENCVALFAKDDEFSVINHQSGECIAIHFNFLKDVPLESFSYKLADPEPFRSLFMQIKKEWDRKDETYFLQSMSTLYGILHHLLMLQTVAGMGSGRSKYVTRAENYIREHYADSDLNLNTLARICDISDGYLRKLFQRYHLPPPNRYITNVRCENAKELLHAGIYSISAIAAMMGFSDVYYFSKVFKVHTGLTPTEYRKLVNIGLSKNNDGRRIT